MSRASKGNHFTQKEREAGSRGEVWGKLEEGQLQEGRRRLQAIERGVALISFRKKKKRFLEGEGNLLLLR